MSFLATFGTGGSICISCAHTMFTGPQFGDKGVGELYRCSRQCLMDCRVTETGALSVEIIDLPAVGPLECKQREQFNVLFPLEPVHQHMIQQSAEKVCVQHSVSLQSTTIALPTSNTLQHILLGNSRSLGRHSCRFACVCTLWLVVAWGFGHLVANSTNSGKVFKTSPAGRALCEDPPWYLIPPL